MCVNIYKYLQISLLFIASYYHDHLPNAS